MAYRKINAPANLPPQVRELVRVLEQHYLQPMHALFRLPVPRIGNEGDFRFAIAHVLLGVVAGVSTTLYKNEGKSGPRFRGVLMNYFPFASEPTGAPAPCLAVETLWSVFRNSLAHDLGFDVGKKAKTHAVKITRFVYDGNGTPEAKMKAMEDSTTRPWTSATLQIRADATVLSVELLYWGVRCVVEKLLAEPDRIQAAEAYLTRLAKH